MAAASVAALARRSHAAHTGMWSCESPLGRALRMSYKDPKAIMIAAARTGSTKAALAPGKALVAGFLAGAYIAFAGLLAITVSAGLKPETWGTLPTLFTGSVFALGLILVVVAGSELLTGNMALVPLAVMRRRASVRALAGNLTWVFI